MSIFGFTDDDKKIFQYRNAKGGLSWADPLPIERSLIKLSRAAGQSLEELAKRATTFPDPKTNKFDADIMFAVQMEAAETLVPIIHAAFGTKPIDPETGEGLTEAQAIKNLSAFYSFLGDVKKNSSSTASGSPSTDGQPESDSPTNSRSDSTSISPVPSPSEDSASAKA